MELSEAERVLLDMINLINLLGYETKEKANLKYENSTYRDAIDTVLKALEDSIIKDEIRKKIEQLEFLRDDAIEDNFLGDARNLKERIDILQELLGEE